MGPVGIRCFCMVQQGLRSDFLAASVCCLIAGAVLLILSFFNAHLEAYPFDSYEQVLGRFIELSFERCAGGGRAAVIMVSAWTLQCVSVVLALLSLVETFPQIYFAGLDDDASVDSTIPLGTGYVAYEPSPYEELCALLDQGKKLRPKSAPAGGRRPTSTDAPATKARGERRTKARAESRTKARNESRTKARGESRTVLGVTPRRQRLLEDAAASGRLSPSR